METVVAAAPLRTQAVNVAVACPPDARSPTAQLRVPETLLQPADALTNASPAGIGSEIVTSAAAVGPAFAAISV
ncbi:MAG TPA: hypothetical protein VGF91_12795 [Solirubrobacteraceae bacterium]